MRCLKVAALLPLLLVPVGAETITLTFSGTWSASLGPVNTGDTFSGSASWDPGTVGEYNPNFAPINPAGYNLTIGNPADVLSVPGAEIEFLGAYYLNGAFYYAQANEQASTGGDTYALYFPVTPGSSASMTDTSSNPNSTIQSSSYSATATIGDLQGGTSSAPVSIVNALPIGGVVGTIGDYGSGESDEYYSFNWDGGAFDASASLTDADEGSSYLFSEGGIGSCTDGTSTTLSGPDFAGTIQIADLAPGEYCIGLEAESTSDPTFTLTFSTPLPAETPEPSGMVLVPIGLMTMGVFYRCRVKSRNCCAIARLW